MMTDSEKVTAFAWVKAGFKKGQGSKNWGWKTKVAQSSWIRGNWWSFYKWAPHGSLAGMKERLYICG